jgi:two-component system response regulator FixJ
LCRTVDVTVLPAAQRPQKREQPEQSKPQRHGHEIDKDVHCLRPPARSAFRVITGIDLLRRVRDGSIDIPVIVITGHGDVSLAVEAMKVGAVDFLEKPFDDEMLLSSVRSALRKGADTARHKAEVSDINDRLAALSNRERQVLEGLVAGKANKVIAFDLGISPRTVEIYRENVMTKISANSLSDLVRMAITAGILTNKSES